MISALNKKLRSMRLTHGSEIDLQDAIARVLVAEHVSFEREAVLSAESRIDFLTHAGDGIEVKVDGSTAQVTRQLHRYAQSPLVVSILLVTTRMRHLHVPRSLGGKAIEVCHLIGGAL